MIIDFRYQKLLRTPLTDMSTEDYQYFMDVLKQKALEEYQACFPA